MLTKALELRNRRKDGLFLLLVRLMNSFKPFLMVIVVFNADLILILL